MLWPVTNSTWFTDRPLLHYTNHIKTTIRSWVMHINRPLCCKGERIHHIFPLMDNLPTPKCVIICKLESCGNLLFTSLSLCNYQIGSIKMLRRYFCLVFQRVQKDDPHIEPFTLLCDRVDVLSPSSSRFLWGQPPSSRSGLPEGLFGRVWSQSEWREAQQPPHNNGLSHQGSRVAFDWHHGAAH